MGELNARDILHPDSWSDICLSRYLFTSSSLALISNDILPSNMFIILGMNREVAKRFSTANQKLLIKVYIKLEACKERVSLRFHIEST
jgi:hypothetical protein